MQLKLLTVRYDPALGSFPTDPLVNIEGEVVSIVEHFFQQSGLPHVLLIVHYRPVREARTVSPAAPRSTPPSDPGVRAELSEPERELFDRLRAWRNSRAQAEGVPPYVLLTNRQVAAIARRRPQALAALREIEGLGEAKAGRFGRELLAVVAPPAPPLMAQPGPEPDHAAVPA